MSKILPFVLTTAIGFAVGIYAGMLIKRAPSIPPPPAAMLDEMKDAPLGSSNPAPPPDARREEAFRQVRAEMEDFRKKIDDIKRSLKTDLEPLLTPEQRERMSRWRERPSPPLGANPPAPGQRRNFWEGFDSAMTIIMVPFTMDRFEDSLKLTPEQKPAVRKLLLERRAKFLELVDTTPPPSFKIPKLAPPEAKAEEPKK